MRICKYAPNMDCKLGVYPTNSTKIEDPPKHKCYENCYFVDCGYCIPHNFINGIYNNFCGEFQWCRYKSEQDPNCEDCHAYRTQTQVDILVKLAIEEANNEANKMTFGKRLRMLRVCKGLTQAQMAEKLGISRRSYIPYEQDKSRPRNKVTYQMMADILDCDINFLLNEEENNHVKNGNA